MASAIEIGMINPFFDKPTTSDGPVMLSMTNPFEEETYGITGVRPTGLDMSNPFYQKVYPIDRSVDYIRPKGELPVKFAAVPQMLGASEP